MKIEEQWALWQESNSLDDIPNITEDQVRDALIKDLTEVSAMSVEEYTLYGKWLEVQNKYPTQTVSTLFGEETQLINPNHTKLINEVKSNIWRPSCPEDYALLEPELVYTSIEEDSRESAGSWSEIWNCIRTFTSTDDQPRFYQLQKSI